MATHIIPAALINFYIFEVKVKYLKMLNDWNASECLTSFLIAGASFFVSHLLQPKTSIKFEFFPKDFISRVSELLFNLG